MRCLCIVATPKSNAEALVTDINDVAFSAEDRFWHSYVQEYHNLVVSRQTIGLESTHLDRKAPNMFYPIKNIGIPSFLTTAIIRVVSDALFIILSIPLAQDSVMAVLPPEGLVPPTKVYQMTEIPKDSANVDEDLCGYKCCSIV
ncbi:hypothetical protein KEM48_008834 [Puccinia striiformis f. sp. tritici PST-130]|nr:hypothetical protein KEM48_008834 [Puccinia striiformis f. sp. tritici PST-130]